MEKIEIYPGVVHVYSGKDPIIRESFLLDDLIYEFIIKEEKVVSTISILNR